MTPDGVVCRARSAIGAGITFRLGAGPRLADQNLPADTSGSCDCSSFVMWALGEQKLRRDLPWLSGFYLNVDQLWSGAVRHDETLGCITEARVGSLFVFPSVRTARLVAPQVKLESAKRDWLEARRTGHIGIVSAVENGKATRVIHLHPANFVATRDLIAETTPELFDNPAAIYAWHSSVCE